MRKKETKLRVFFVIPISLPRSFERAKESWQLDGDQKLEQARMFKERGTAFFKQGKFDLAARKYKKIIDFLEHEISLKGE